MLSFSIQFSLCCPRRTSPFLNASEKKPQQVILSTICLHHYLCSFYTSTESESRLPFGFSAFTGMNTCKTMASTATVNSLLASNKVYLHNSTLVPPLPDILSSPTRRMCGQCWRVLIKKGFVTPTTMFGLERGEKRQNNANLRVSFTHRQWQVGSKGLLVTYGACVLVVYSLNSLSWIVK